MTAKFIIPTQICPGIKMGMSEECLNMSPEVQTRSDQEGEKGKQNFSLTYGRA